ncbi:MAG: hypothetical protein ACTSXP_11935, partial [Promethearchaeota archaeon]
MVRIQSNFLLSFYCFFPGSFPVRPSGGCLKRGVFSRSFQKFYAKKTGYIKFLAAFGIIIVLLLFSQESTNFAKVSAFSGTTGTDAWYFTTGNGMWSSPAIGDVDGDGQLEVVVGSNNYNVYCISAINGSHKWSYSTNGVVLSGPVIEDVDN